MNRISSLFVATTLAILPISAFAQQDAASAKPAVPNTVVSTAPAATTVAPGMKTTDATKTADSSKTMGGKTATTVAPANTAVNATQPTKHDGKTNMVDGKKEVHGMNTLKSHNGKSITPAAGKTAEPTKS